jgi:hypothetical protein
MPVNSRLPKGYKGRTQKLISGRDTTILPVASGDTRKPEWLGGLASQGYSMIKGLLGGNESPAAMAARESRNRSREVAAGSIAFHDDDELKRMQLAGQVQASYAKGGVIPVGKRKGLEEGGNLKTEKFKQSGFWNAMDVVNEGGAAAIDYFTGDYGGVAEHAGKAVALVGHNYLGMSDEKFETMNQLASTAGAVTGMMKGNAGGIKNLAGAANTAQSAGSAVKAAAPAAQQAFAASNAVQQGVNIGAAAPKQVYQGQGAVQLNQPVSQYDMYQNAQRLPTYFAKGGEIKDGVRMNALGYPMATGRLNNVYPELLPIGLGKGIISAGSKVISQGAKDAAGVTIKRKTGDTTLRRVGKHLKTIGKDVIDQSVDDVALQLQGVADSVFHKKQPVYYAKGGAVDISGNAVPTIASMIASAPQRGAKPTIKPIGNNEVVVGGGANKRDGINLDIPNGIKAKVNKGEVLKVEPQTGNVKVLSTAPELGNPASKVKQGEEGFEEAFKEQEMKKGKSNNRVGAYEGNEYLYGYTPRKKTLMPYQRMKGNGVTTAPARGGAQDLGDNAMPFPGLGLVGTAGRGIAAIAGKAGRVAGKVKNAFKAETLLNNPKTVYSVLGTGAAIAAGGMGTALYDMHGNLKAADAEIKADAAKLNNSIQRSSGTATPNDSSSAVKVDSTENPYIKPTKYTINYNLTSHHQPYGNQAIATSETTQQPAARTKRRAVVKPKVAVPDLRQTLKFVAGKDSTGDEATEFAKIAPVTNPATRGVEQAVAAAVPATTTPATTAAAATTGATTGTTGTTGGVPVKGATPKGTTGGADSKGSKLGNLWGNVKEWGSNPDNISDLTNALAPIAAAQVGYKAASELKGPAAQARIPYEEFRDKINVTPQINASRRAMHSTISDVNENSVSSAARTARNSKALNDNAQREAQIYGAQQNQEAAMFNQGAAARSQTNTYNAMLANQFAKENADVKNTSTMLKAQSINSGIAGTAAAFRDMQSRRDKNNMDSQSLLAMIAGSPEGSAERMIKFGVGNPKVWATMYHSTTDPKLKGELYNKLTPSQRKAYGIK